MVRGSRMLDGVAVDTDALNTRQQALQTTDHTSAPNTCSCMGGRTGVVRLTVALQSVTA